MTRALYTPAELSEADAWLRTRMRETIKTQVTHLTVSEWATAKRILPQGLSPLPGPWSWEVTPYLREIADCFSATSSVREVAFMKGSRIGATVGVLENIIGYVIDAEPGPMLYVGADAEAAETAVEMRVDQMISSAGLSHKIFSQGSKAHGKKTGDTKSKKEFPGGALLTVGPNSGAKLRGFGAQYALLDEIDAYRLEVGSTDKKAKTAAEGDPITLVKRRTDEYEATRKILYISTPLQAQTSRINQLFLEGDQRRYFVPCKHCGAMQYLKWRGGDGKYRIKYEVDKAGRLVWDSVHYECEVCGTSWKNTDKAWFLPRGEWRATAESARPGFRSYHAPSMISAIGMRSWEDACQEWIAANA